MLADLALPLWIAVPLSILVVIGVFAAICVGYFWYRNWRYGPDRT